MVRVWKVTLRSAANVLFADSIDWGEGQLRVLEEIDGYLIGISDSSSLDNSEITP